MQNRHEGGDVGGLHAMQDTMNALMKSMNRLKQTTTILNVWTILVIIILAGLIGVNVLAYALLPEPFLAILGGVYLAFLLVLFIANWLIKDTQKQIMISLIRAILGFILAIPLVILGFTLLVKILAVIFAVVFLIIFLLLLLPILELAKLQKQLKAEPEVKPKAKAKPKARAKPKAKAKSK
jgi:hypothetical protein